LELLALVGFIWGYLAALWTQLDFLQPGRHTYVFFTALTVAGGVALASAFREILHRSRFFTTLLVTAALLLAVRIFAGEITTNVRSRVLDSKFLSSQPSNRLLWLVENIRERFPQGGRLLYEECGTDLPGVPDPYSGGRFSGLLPYLTGVELIGGPYLQAAIKTNFTQFGAGKLFGQTDWDLDFFRRHARMYRPQGIICWSPKALAFCEAHPEVVEIVSRDERVLPVFDPRARRYVASNSRVLFGLIRGFDGSAIQGRAEIRAEAGRLHVTDAVADELDGLVVLGYHSVPRLRARPPLRIESVRLGDDPVPFIGFRPPAGPFVLEMDFHP
jgi:hypothetical protein